MLICETKKEARWRFVALRNALDRKGFKMNISKMKVMKCARDMWLLAARAMFRSARKCGKSGTGFCVQNVQRWREKGS